MPTLILSPRYTTDSQILIRAARTLGWQTVRLVNHQLPDHIDPKEIILYGESYFVEYIAQEVGLNLIAPHNTFLTTLPFHYVKRQIKLVTKSAFEPLTANTFVKTADMKSIPARVYLPNEPIPGFEALLPDDPLLLSEPVEWQVEYRCFVLQKQLSAISIYLYNGETAVDENGRWLANLPTDQLAKEFMQSILNDPKISLPEALLIDVGFIPDRGWAVVEANPAWSSGIYHCEPQGVLATLRAATSV